MNNLIDLEKKINSGLTTKIKKSEIKHNQLYLNIDSESLIDVTLFIKNNENTKFSKLRAHIIIVYFNIFKFNLITKKIINYI